MTCSMVISATTSAGVMEGECSQQTNLFSLDRSTHMHILSLFFLRATTIGAHHSVSAIDYRGNLGHYLTSGQNGKHDSGTGLN